VQSRVQPSSFPSCPDCGSKKVTKKGTRKTRHDVRQRYKCAACSRLFVKEAAQHSSYPVRLIMEGIGFVAKLLSLVCFRYSLLR